MLSGQKVQIAESYFEGEDGSKHKVAILVGGLGKESPKGFMDKIVKEYTDNAPHNEFIEIFLDNPYVRVIVDGINEIKFEEYNKQRLINQI